MTASSRRHRSGAAFRALTGVVGFAAFAAGVPALLWWGSGNRLFPEPGPGGWRELVTQLRYGQLPESAVLGIAVALGWALWAYLLLLVLSELAAVWREGDPAQERTAQLTRPRRLVARLVGWAFAGHTVVASLFIVPPPADTPPAVVAAAIDPASADSDALYAMAAGEPPGGFDRDAYVNFTASGPDVEGDQEAEVAAPRPATIERTIVPGDNLWNIAEELTGDGTNWAAIWAATDLAAQHPPVDPHNPDLIFPGNVVRIPTDLIAEQVPDLSAPPALPAPPSDAAPLTPPTTTPDQPVPQPPGSAPGVHADEESTPDQRVQPPRAGWSGLSTGIQPAPVVAVALGLGGAAGAVVLAGAARRRRRSMAASLRGQRPPNPAKRADRTRRRLAALQPAGMWSPDDLAASWNSLDPLEPGARQPWCVRWNSALEVLECAWTPDTTDGGGPAGDATDPPEPKPGSPWKLVTKQDRSGREVKVWTITEDDVPPRPPRDVLPAMVGCADGRRDRPSSDGFFINLEAAGIICVESSNISQIEPEGVVRALLLQLQANQVAEVHLLNTDLGFDDLDAPHIHADPIELESRIVSDLARHRPPWDTAPSMFAARSEQIYEGRVSVVVGPAEDLQSCSHLLSLARAENVPLVVIALGPLAHAWASFHLVPEPDKHTIRFPAARAVLSFDHVSWVSAAEAAELADMIAASSRPWTTRTDADADLDDDPFDPPGIDEHRAPADGETADGAADCVDDPDPDDGLTGQHDQPGPIGLLGSKSTAATGLSTVESWTTPTSHSPDLEYGDDLSRDLWNLLPEADPTTMADEANALDDARWAVIGEDTDIDQVLDVTLTDLLAGSADLRGADPGGQETNGATCSDVDQLLLAEPEPWREPPAARMSHDAIGVATSSSSTSTGPSVASNGVRPAAEATVRVDRICVAPSTESRGYEHEPRSSHDLPATTAGLRLELCGPIRLRRLDPAGGGLLEVPLSSDGLSASQLALLAYLTVAGRPNGGGVGREQIAVEFWPDTHTDGSSRAVQSSTVKRRIVELRSSLAKLVTGDNVKAVFAGAIEGRYALSLATDWHELRAAVIKAEAATAGSTTWADAVVDIVGTVRPPGLLTPPDGARQRRYAWIDNHYAAHVQDLVRRVLAILADQAQVDRAVGRYRQALDVLAVARSITPIYTQEIADAVVATYLSAGDLVRAEQECLAYERQFDQEFLARERRHPQPGNPRVRLNEYLNHQHNGDHDQ